MNNIQKISEASSGMSDERGGWRNDLSQIDVWYGSYGSNMWKPRFLCYIEGGKVEGMIDWCSGSRDKRPPKDTIWRTFPNRLFFGRDATPRWGPGGVSFLTPTPPPPTSNDHENTYLCLYKITLEQFNDVLHQENNPSYDMSSPLFDQAGLDLCSTTGSALIKAIKGSWYDNVVFLGKEGDIPIITMTCSLEDAGKYQSGEIPVCAPSEGYAETLVKGLVVGEQMSEEEALAYIEIAASKPL